MKYISCWCMLTFCSYQYLIEISMYWKVRSAWAWFKSKWIFSKKKPNNSQPQCVFKDLIDSKDTCECKNGIPRLGWLKGSSLKKDLEHLRFWSSSSRPGQEESCVMCACWAMPKKKKTTLPNPGTIWSEIDGRNAWVMWARMAQSFSRSLMCGCAWWFCLFVPVWVPLCKCRVPVLVPCVSPLPPPTHLPLVRFWVAACPWSGIVLVLLLHCSQLASSGFGILSLSFSFSLSLSLAPCCFIFFPKATCPFAFHLLIH